MTDPLLCVTVSGRSMDELRRARDGAHGADLVELRLDGVSDPDPAAALEGRRRPVIVTCRPAWEGGAFQGSEEERRRILEEAAALGAEFVDVEAAASFAPAIIRARHGRGVIASMHCFDDVPADLPARYHALRSMCAEVAKLAVKADSLSDLLPLFDVARHESTTPGSHVLVAMGESGVPSRILAARLRNRWTYAGAAVAPGQLPAARMLGEFRFRRIRPETSIYGVAGNPVAHSRSPVMHNAGFAALGLDATYLPLHARDAADFARFARALGVRGASITAPLKVALMEYVDEVEPLAQRVGAINTLVVRDGRWVGFNTDVDGFLTPLAGRIALKGVRASVLGAGGAARAVAVALASQGAAVTVCARRSEAARVVADIAGGCVGTFPPRPGSWDVLANATPAGSDAAATNPIAAADLDGEIVFDLVYEPAETPLLKAARAAGCMTIGGLEMLIAQAERQFELWTGRRPPAGLFQDAASHRATSPVSHSS